MKCAVSALLATIQNMQNQINGMKNELTQSQQATARVQEARVNNEVSTFAEDPEHPYFDEVSDQIVLFLESGLDLKTAYDQAVWANPVTRQKELDRALQGTEKKLTDKRKKEVDKAKKLKSANVRGRNTNKTHTASLGSMEDTMRDTMRDIKSRH